MSYFKVLHSSPLVLVFVDGGLKHFIFSIFFKVFLLQLIIVTLQKSQTQCNFNISYYRNYQLFKDIFKLDIHFPQNPIPIYFLWISNVCLAVFCQAITVCRKLWFNIFPDIYAIQHFKFNFFHISLYID